MLNRPRLHMLDGLRCLAATWVVLAHLWGFYYGGLRPGLGGLVTNWLYYPHLAVDIFIVLSGFCLMLPTLSTTTAAATGTTIGPALHDGAARFYRRRATRILPPLYASLAISMLIAALAARGGGHGLPLGPAVIASNLLLLQDWCPQWKYVNPVTWSVALELKIYLLFPGMLLLRRTAGWGVTSAAAAVLAAGVLVAALWLRPTWDLSFTCPWYLVLFVLGAAACEWAHRPQARLRSAAGWVALAASAGAFAIVLRAPAALAQGPRLAVEAVQDTLFGAAVAAILFLTTVGAAPRLTALLAWRPLVWVGTASYSLYLIHLPSLDVARVIVNRLRFLPAGKPWQLAAVAVIGLTATGIATGAFFRWVERPFLTARRGRAPAAVLADAVAVSPAP